jgi:hypothetical protein
MKRKIVLGALAGALGGLVMKAIVRWVDPQAFGLSSETDARSAHALWSRVTARPLGESTAEDVGAAMHYAFAVAAGAVYGACFERCRWLRAGSGTLFGISLWIAGDEIAVTAMGLEDPRRTPLRSHLSALAAHVAYGAIVDKTLDRLSGPNTDEI